MTIQAKLAVFGSAACLVAGACALPINAQIVPDSTLPTHSIVTPNANVFTINGGTEAGSNLFHSFQEFSIPTGNEAFFNNVLTIDNIITRVTGGNISNIDGLIRANGSANLFLINPNGIQFGPNARLNIGGSFLSSSADRVLFEDGTFFSATEANTPSLLTLNVPIGLQWNQATPASINLQGTNLNIANGETLVLLGGNVNLTGSTLNAPGGRVELGGLSAPGTVQLNEFQGLSFPEGIARSDVFLNGESTVNVAAGGNGNIAIRAGNLTLSEASQLVGGLGEGLGSADTVAGNITIDATGNTTLSDRSLITNDVETEALGNGGGIALTTETLELTGGSRIQTITNSTGSSGEININANGLINISGFTDDGLFSGILSRSASATSGTGGNITVNNPQNLLNLSNRGFIGAITNSNSNSGGIEINVNNLTLETGGQIVTATTNLGNAGNILINATESVRLSGESPDFVNNPFLDFPVFDLDTLAWLTTPNPNVEASGTIPYVSVERTPEQIISGTTLLGTAETGVDYYSFSVNRGGGRGIFDIDGGFSNAQGDVDTHIFLFNRGTGELLVQNSESTDIDPGSQESSEFPGFTFDTVIDTTLEEPGIYLLGVSAFTSNAANNQLIEGATVEVGNTYTLNVSLEHQGTEGVSLPIDPFNPANYNPNIRANSGLLSESSNTGHAGQITINTGQLIANNNSIISTDTFGVGMGGDIDLNATHSIDVSELSSIASIAHSSGNAGNIAINTGRLQFLNGGSMLTEALSAGNAGNITLVVNESVTVAGESSGTRSTIGNDLVSGSTGNGGNISIDVPVLRLLDGGQISSGVLGEGDGGNLNIRANLVEAIGSDIGQAFPSGIAASAAQGTGNAANISIVTEDLRLIDGAQIFNLTRSQGNAGELVIQALNSVEIVGQNEADLPSGLLANADLSSTGNGGNLLVETELLRIADGGLVTASTLGDGDGGNLTIVATTVEVSDAIVDFTGTVSGLNVSVGEQSMGSGGNLRIEADSLRVFDGGQVTASTLGAGDAGNIILRVDEIEVAGISEDGEFVSSISALSETDFAAGSIDITADRLQVRDRGEITVSSSGTGNAGNLNIAADIIDLDIGGRLSSEVQAGSQGNINLSTDRLRLRRGSSITTNASETATGGNVDINTNTLALIQNSRISADAVAGAGGNISITTEGIFVSPDSSITASSQFGIDGVVEIIEPDVDSSHGLVELSEKPVESSDRVSTGCATRHGSSFVIAGLRGVPENPNSLLRGTTVWEDLRPLEIGGSTDSNEEDLESIAPGNHHSPLVEATSWETDDRGEIQLVAATSRPFSLANPTDCR